MFLNYGRHPEVLRVQGQEQPNASAEQQAAQWQKAMKTAEKGLLKVQQKMWKDQDPKRRQQQEWQPGTKVYLSRKNIKTLRPNEKLDYL